MNRQINERQRTLIAAYRVLGGSFTGNLAINPTHLRDLRSEPMAESEAADPLSSAVVRTNGSDRTRRIRDAVEAAVSDIILLGTEEQVRLAERAAHELVAGRPIHTHELVVSLRDFIRKTHDLDPVPADLSFPCRGLLGHPLLEHAAKANAEKTDHSEVLAAALAKGSVVAVWVWTSAGAAKNCPQLVIADRIVGHSGSRSWETG